MLREVQAQNRELSRRLSGLENAPPTPAKRRIQAPTESNRPESRTDGSNAWLARWPAAEDRSKSDRVADQTGAAQTSSPIIEAPSKPPAAPEPRDTSQMG